MTKSTNTDQEHLRMLSIFHYVLSGMMALSGCFPFIHLSLGIALLAAPEAFDATPPPPPVVGYLFVAIASLLIVTMWTIAVLLMVAGRSLTHRKRYGFCFFVAALSCLFMPLGTALGVFTILVLQRPTVKQLFGRGPAEGVSPHDQPALS